MLCTGRSRRAYCGAVLAALFRCIIFLCHSMLDGNVGEEEEVQQPLECCRGRCRHGYFFFVLCVLYCWGRASYDSYDCSSPPNSFFSRCPLLSRSFFSGGFVLSVLNASGGYVALSISVIYSPRLPLINRLGIVLLLF